MRPARPLLALLTALLLINALPQPARGAHSASEIDAWQRAWADRVLAVDGPTAAQIEEWVAFMARPGHRCAAYGTDCPEPQPVSASTRRAEAPKTGNGAERWRSLVAGYFPPGLVDMALCVIGGESGGNPAADNPRSSALGLWQFLRSTWNSTAAKIGAPAYPAGPRDPEWATRAAWQLYQDTVADGRWGWAPWNAAQHC